MHCHLILLLLPSLVLISNIALSQVINNDIEQRVRLPLDSLPLLSSTTDCTVQWQCVDQSLTGKCIQYHNDQWFYFTTENSMKYYLNIVGQKCRDLRGVQLVVIDGVPCSPKTYNILNCTSLATQDDIFVELDSLKPFHTYLLNVDGYLNDHCQFNIQFSTTPRGLPLELIEKPIGLDITKQEDRVMLHWEVGDTLASKLIGYEVFRRHEHDKKFVQTKTVSHEKNAFGTSRSAYSVTDTINKYGTYHYKIVGVTNTDERLLLSTHSVKLFAPTPKLYHNLMILAVPCTMGETLTISIYNAQGNQLIKTEQVQCDGTEYIWKYYLSPQILADTRIYTIIVEKADGTVKEFYYDKKQ